MAVAVIGAGIGGLAAARRLRQRGIDVVVFEGTARVGGKLRLETVGEVRLDVGAEAMLATRPEALDLCRSAGLDVEHPETLSASVWTRGALRPLPPTVMGIPSDMAALMASGIVDRPPTARAVPLPEGDISIADYVRARAGDEVLDRLVEPLFGGVYAGCAERLSLAAAGERLLRLGPDPLAAAAQIAAPSGPILAGVVGGMGLLPATLAGELDVRLNSRVVGLERASGRWLVHTSAGVERADAVLVATPAPAAARLLAEVAPRAAYELADVEVASVAIITLVFDVDLDVPGSGFLVPPVEGRTIKGATFSSNKWRWLRQAGRTVLRASVGRAGETALLQVDDASLTSTVFAELTSALGVLPAPTATHVQRWGGALPQYGVGHLDRVAAIEADIAAVPGLAACGASYRGVGIAAVVSGALGAADTIST